MGVDFVFEVVDYFVEFGVVYLIKVLLPRHIQLIKRQTPLNHPIPLHQQMRHPRLLLLLYPLLPLLKRLPVLYGEDVADEGGEGVVVVVLGEFVVGGDGHFAYKLIHLSF